MAEKMIIEGGYPLQGTVHIAGAKNAALKLIPASLLTREPVILRNVPLIHDFEVMLTALTHLGATFEWLDEHTLKIQAKDITSFKIPEDIVSQMRASFVILGPLLARFRKAIIANPGGCRIGARPVNRHIDGFSLLGAEVTYTEGYYHINGQTMKPGEIVFEKNTHTGTENLILGSVLTEGQTILTNAAEEPEVDDLIAFLNKMGADIRRVEPRKIVITGVKELYGTDYTIMPDRNEAVTFAVAAAITHGKLFLKGARAKDLVSFLNKLEKVGVSYEAVADGIHVWHKKENPFLPIDIETRHHPGFMTDWHPLMAVLLTQAEGVSTIHETVMDKRFIYAQELKRMGADIEFYNPQHYDPANYGFNIEDAKEGDFHAVKISGPTQLTPAQLEMSDLRAGATLILAALIATGVSEITGIHHVRRGYERLEERLRSIGAKISVIEE